MAEIELELENELVEGMRRLAARHYGDSGDASVWRVIEAASEMCLLWLNLVEGGGNEMEEPGYRLMGAERTPLWDQFWKSI